MNVSVVADNRRPPYSWMWWVGGRFWWHQQFWNKYLGHFGCRSVCAGIPGTIFWLTSMVFSKEAFKFHVIYLYHHHVNITMFCIQIFGLLFSHWLLPAHFGYFVGTASSTDLFGVRVSEILLIYMQTSAEFILRRDQRHIKSFFVSQNIICFYFVYYF